MQLAKDIQIAKVGDAVAMASNTDSNSTRIDMAGWTGVIFFTVVNDSAATGVATLKVEENTADSDTGMAALSGASAAVTCAVNDDVNGKILITSVHEPRERYVQGVRTSATANMAFGECYALLYGPRAKPKSDHSTVGASGHTVSPAEV